ncbi:MAG: glycosyltransferase family 39 protein [Candidatus Tritonobacter lacicola]|nr:glycosyltransferase family 39 protein [Candidatus Tritonobacter lacicola]
MTASKTLIFFMVLSLILRLFLCFQAPEVLISRVASDDMFYYLCIARSIGEGLGATADGENVTNGFHPLWALTLVPLSRVVGEGDSMLQWSLALLSLFSVLSAWFLYRIARLFCGEASSLLAALLWLFCPYPLLVALAGVEAPLFVLMLGAASYVYLLLRRKSLPADASRWRWAGVGLLAGAAVLARIDGLVLAAFIFIDVLFGKRDVSLPCRLGRALSFACACFLVTLPWFAWSYMRTGYLLQVSGKAIYHQQHFIFWAQHGTASLGEYASVWVAMVLSNLQGALQSVLFLCGFKTGLFYAVFAMFAVIFIFAAILAPRRFREWAGKLAPLLFLFCYGLLMFFLYCGYLWYNQNWYYYSIFFIVLILGACLIDLLDRTLFSFIPRHGRTYLWAALFVLLTGLSLLGTFRWWERGIRGWQIDGYRTAMWVKDNVPKESRIGSFNSGLLAYYCPQTVINLDGVVNGASYRAMKEGKSFSHIRKERLDYIVETPLSLRFRAAHSEREFLSSLAPIHAEATYPESIARRNPVTVYRILP